ncbi:MAG: ATP-binding protein [Phycisphaerae bacterium]
MKRYINLLLLVICCEIILPIPYLADAATRTGIDPVNSLMIFGGLILLLLLITLLLRSQDQEKTIDDLKRNISDYKLKAGELNEVNRWTKGNLEPNLTQAQEDYLWTVKKTANSLQDLINKVDDFSRNEMDEGERKSIDFGLRSSLDSALDTLARTAEENGLKMILRVDDNVPDALVGDADQLRQVVINLLSNAIKVTEKGEVGLHLQVQSVHEDKIYLHFAISDTGPGIPPENRETLLNAFSLGDTFLNRENGPGLSFTCHLIRMMDGAIWVESPSNVNTEGPGGPGSTFHVTLWFGLHKKYSTGTIDHKD